MMSIGFAMSIFFGALFLNEPITMTKVFGTLFIIAGSALLGYEGGKDNE
jgi:drug/metabolite transporter (DMT)-like permease